MIQPEPLRIPVFNLNSGDVHTIDVPGMPELCRIAVFLWFSEQAYRNTSGHRRNQGVRVTLIRDPIHNHIDLLRFSRVREYRTVCKFGVAIIRRPVQLGIDWKRRIAAGQWTTDICIVGVSRCIGPKVVILCFEAINDGRIISEVNCLIDIVSERRRRYKESRRIVRPAELHFVLANKHHHLPMKDSVVDVVSHGNASVCEHVEDLLVAGVNGIGSRIHENTYRYTLLVFGDDFVSVRCVLHEPERHVYANRFIVY